MGRRLNKGLQSPWDLDYQRTYKAARMDAGDMALEVFASAWEMERGQGP